LFHDGAATTAIFFRVTEDLGGGLSANFQYEMNPDLVGGAGVSGVGLGQTSLATASGTTTTTATSGLQYANSATGANGNNFLSLKSATAGELKLGRLNTGTLSAWGTASVFGTKLGGGYGSAGQYARYGATATTYWNTAPTRFNNAIEYTTPAMSGFTGRFLYVPMVDQGSASSAQNTATGSGASSAGATNISTTATGTAQSAGVNRAGVQDVSIAYNQGPLNVMGAVQTIKYGSNGVNSFVGVGPTTTAGSTSTLTTLAANYKFGNTTVYGGTWTEKQDAATAVDITGRIIGVKYTVGATDLMASTTSTVDNASTAVNRKLIGLGANYNLSKNSFLYARFESRDANTGASGDISTEGVTKTTAVGLERNF